MSGTHFSGRRGYGDEGTAAIELAIVAPWLILFLLGILEYGLVFKDYQALGNALRAGGRMAAVQGNYVEADYQIIQTIKRNIGAVQQSNVKRIVVWRATGNTAMPAVCGTTTPPAHLSANKCNVYVPSQDWNPPDPDGTGPQTPAANYDCTTKNWATGWCPTDRISTLKVNGVPVTLDMVGIFIELDHPYITKLFGNTKTLKDSIVVRIEPKSLDTVT